MIYDLISNWRRFISFSVKNFNCKHPTASCHTGSQQQKNEIGNVKGETAAAEEKKVAMLNTYAKLESNVKGKNEKAGVGMMIKSDLSCPHFYSQDLSSRTRLKVLARI